MLSVCYSWQESADSCCKRLYRAVYSVLPDAYRIPPAPPAPAPSGITCSCWLLQTASANRKKKREKTPTCPTCRNSYSRTCTHVYMCQAVMTLMYMSSHQCCTCRACTDYRTRSAHPSAVPVRVPRRDERRRGTALQPSGNLERAPAAAPGTPPRGIEKDDMNLDTSQMRPFRLRWTLRRPRSRSCLEALPKLDTSHI